MLAVINKIHWCVNDTHTRRRRLMRGGLRGNRTSTLTAINNCMVDCWNCWLHFTSHPSDSQIFVENRDVCLPHLHSTPPESEYWHNVWCGSTRMVWLPDGENILKIRLLSRVSILTRDVDKANLSVCLSVRNVPVSDENGLTYRRSFSNHTVAQSF